MLRHQVYGTALGIEIPNKTEMKYNIGKLTYICRALKGIKYSFIEE